MKTCSWTRKLTTRAAAHGAFQRLPYVYTASEIQEMRFWRASVQENYKIVDPVKRAKNHTSRLINHQLGKLSSMTRQLSLAFPPLRQLHPFERDVLVLTIGKNVYDQHVQQLRKVYAALHNAGRKHERECQAVRTKQEAIDCGLRCIEEFREIIENHSVTLRQVAEMSKSLRALPCIELDRPIFAFVGAPNVGKSSLVRSLSTATPEVANYPFTTRGVSIGHIFVDGSSFQIADTPGLLYRPDAKRNAIEKLALAMMEKTQAAIGFVLDPTGLCGTTIGDQLSLREEIHDRVHQNRSSLKWIDIISKADHPELDIPLLQSRFDNGLDSSVVSTKTNQGLVELSEKIQSILTESS